MINISECPICKGNTLTDLADCIDYTVSHETFHVKQCNNCLLGITSPRPDDNLLGNYYKSEEYISHSGKSSGGIGKLYKIARAFSLQWKRNLILKHKKGNALLDFGCGTGEFIANQKKHGWKVSGVEPSDTAREKAITLTNSLISRNLVDIKNEKFDVITAWHVIEHVPDLPGTLTQLKNLLNQKGLLFIAVPNYQSTDADIYNHHWAGYDVPRHLWHFARKSMTQLLESQGLKLVSIVPMKLDSYYISLLSEKYKNQNHLTPLSVIKAFANGFISNLKARTKTNHSSLIYIARIHEE